MDDPRSQDIAVREKFAALGRAVAAALDREPGADGPGWTHEAETCSPGSVRLRHPAGWHLRLWRERSTGAAGRRWTVTGCTPTDDLTDDRITVAAGRAPSAIAAEIRRRLLPAHRVTMRQALVHLAEQENHACARQRAMARLRSALPALEPYSHDRDGISGSFYAGQAPGRAHASGSARINHQGESVELDLHSVPLDLAVRILALLDAASQPLTGTVMPPPISRTVPELTAAPQVVPGEILAAITTPAEAVSRRITEVAVPARRA